MSPRFVLGSIFAVALPFAASLGCEESRRASVECPEGATVLNGTCIVDYAVRVNSVGYLTSRIKRAAYVGSSSSFSLRRVDDDEEVYSGEASGPERNRDTEEELYVAEFTDFTTAGEYYVSTEDGRSAPFRIGDDVLDEALDITMLGLYGQRCGEKVEFEFQGDEYFHAECHMEPAELSRIGEGTKDDTGGWHDAGDYGKYTVNGAFAAAFLLKAYEHFPEYLKERALLIPESGDDVPDMLDEARVELDWLLKVQLEDGSFSHKVTAQNFESVVAPSVDTQTRFFLSASSSGTGDAVATLALAARLYGEFDEDFAARCLEAARRGQNWLDENPGEVVSDQSGVLTGGYHSGGDEDERLWALAELWETTGDAAYLEALEGLVDGQRLDSAFDWANVKNLGLSTFVRSKRAGRSPELVDQVARGFVEIAEGHVFSAEGDQHGRAIGSYYWGVNGTLARIAFNLVTAHYVAPDSRYADTIHLQLDHLFGKNPYARSYVTRLGENPVQKPHHRPSEADGVQAPWPGLLIGGPHGQGLEGEAAEQLPALTWTDEYDNYWHNEVAINWSTALAYALVAISAFDDDSPACEDCLGAGGASNGEGGQGGGP